MEKEKEDEVLLSKEQNLDPDSYRESATDDDQRATAGKINFCIQIISLLLRQIKQK
jgi:hypothetical protein